MKEGKRDKKQSKELEDLECSRGTNQRKNTYHLIENIDKDMIYNGREFET